MRRQREKEIGRMAFEWWSRTFYPLYPFTPFFFFHSSSTLLSLAFVLFLLFKKRGGKVAHRKLSAASANDPAWSPAGSLVAAAAAASDSLSPSCREGERVRPLFVSSSFLPRGEAAFTGGGAGAGGATSGWGWIFGRLARVPAIVSVQHRAGEKATTQTRRGKAERARRAEEVQKNII